MAVIPQFPGYRLASGVFDARTVLRGRSVFDSRVVPAGEDWLNGTTWANQWAIRFDGMSSMANMTRPAFMDTLAAWSVSAWVRPNTALSAGGFYPILGPDLGASGFNMIASGTPLRWGLRATFVTDGLKTIEDITAGPSLNTWSHLLLTYDGTTMRAYVNGSALATTHAVSNKLLNWSTTTDFRLAARGGSVFSPVDMTQLAVFNAAILPTVVRSAGGVPLDLTGASGLVAWWQLGNGYNWNTYRFQDSVGGGALSWVNGVQATQVVPR